MEQLRLLTIKKLRVFVSPRGEDKRCDPGMANVRSTKWQRTPPTTIRFCTPVYASVNHPGKTPIVIRQGRAYAGTVNANTSRQFHHPEKLSQEGKVRHCKNHNNHHFSISLLRRNIKIDRKSRPQVNTSFRPNHKKARETGSGTPVPAKPLNPTLYTPAAPCNMRRFLTPEAKLDEHVQCPVWSVCGF